MKFTIVTKLIGRHCKFDGRFILNTSNSNLKKLASHLIFSTLSWSPKKLGGDLIFSTLG
jgi:hypothetical protein